MSRAGRPFRWPAIRELTPAQVVSIALLEVTPQSFERTIARENRRRDKAGTGDYLVLEVRTRTEIGLGTHLVASVSCVKVVTPDAEVAADLLSSRVSPDA